MAISLGIRKATNFLAISILLFLFSCSKEKDTVPAKIYHNTTSYFNGYYNATYLYKETIDRLEEQYDFAEQGFIEVVYYGTEDEIKSYDTDFENIIKKNDRVIFKHPNGNFIDNCRLLNGKSWFYRQNYTLAMENFDYVMEAFPDSRLVPEALFWIAKTHYMRENTEMTKSILDEGLINNDTIFIEPELMKDIALFRTRLAIQDEEYKAAATILNENIELLKNKGRKSRAHFLLGQLFAEVDEYPKALENFFLVEKFSADYDLTFQSKIKIARLYVDFQEGKDDDSQVYKYLNKLLKDEKNEEYQDQIYFEFALLELKKGNRDLAIDYLKESIIANLSNQRQKALSYYKIGQIYFNELQEYTTAQAYYDSAASVIQPDAPEYKEIKAIAATLKDYITYINTISYQDSMIYLSGLPKEELDVLIAEIVKEEKRKKEEELARQLEEMQQASNSNNFYNPQLQQFQNQGNGNSRRNQGGRGGVWYFDNPTAISSGKVQFEQLWGKRKNEDNWRRSRKMSNFSMAPDEKGGREAEAAPVDSALLEKYGANYQYYKDIPQDEKGIEEAQFKIEDAMYKLGQLYAQKLNEPDSAVKTFETMLDRFEGSEYALQARYALYNLYNETGNPIAQVHKNFILNEHPQTVYAYLILGKDPNDLKKGEEDFKFVYDGLFSSYSSREYETSLGFSEFILSQNQYQGNPELDIARLHYIRGMSYGFLGQKDSLIEILGYVIKNFPEADVTPIAKRTLGYAHNGGKQVNKKRPEETLSAAKADQPVGSDSPTDPNNPKYRGFKSELKPTDKIFVLMFIDKNIISKSEANAKIADFNKKNYSDKKLKVFTFLYQQSHLLPYISSFKKVDVAKKYISDFQATAESKTVIQSENEKIFFISHTNFKVAYGQKRMEDYIAYYENILSK